MQSPEWKGGSPQRFSGGRRHVMPQDELNHLYISASHSPSLGIKTFALGQTPEQRFKPTVRIFPESYSPQPRQVDFREIKSVYFSDQRERIRPQKRHLSGNRETQFQMQLKGLRTFQQANKSRKNEYDLESRMQAKMRVIGLEQQRNNFGISSLGDKSYRYPEYASNFFKDGGLISGSTSFRLRSGEESPLNASKLKSILTKPMWKDKLKMQERQQESRVLDAVDEWERTILKEANPKWNDPDTFFQRLQKQGGVGGGKEVKKGSKK